MLLAPIGASTGGETQIKENKKKYANFSKIAVPFACAQRPGVILTALSPCAATTHGRVALAGTCFGRRRLSPFSGFHPGFDFP
jgi:hypothetical protein